MICDDMFKMSQVKFVNSDVVSDTLCHYMTRCCSLRISTWTHTVRLLEFLQTTDQYFLACKRWKCDVITERLVISCTGGGRQAFCYESVVRVL